MCQALDWENLVISFKSYNFVCVSAFAFISQMRKFVFREAK